MTRKSAAPFATEAEMCRRFLDAVPEEWVPYAETAGWDILMVRRSDGFQIGIEAKLKLNAAVINQAIESDCTRYHRSGPDCRAVMVPDGSDGSLQEIAAYIGVTVIRVMAPRDRGGYGPAFMPGLPAEDHDWSLRHWFENCPEKRHELLEFVPDVVAGAPAPVQLTKWKIGAIRLAVTLERRGYLTRADFRQHRIDHRRWTAGSGGWLRAERGRYVAAPGLPDFKAQHPRVYAEILATAEDWLQLPSEVPTQEAMPL